MTCPKVRQQDRRQTKSAPPNVRKKELFPNTADGKKKKCYIVHGDNREAIGVPSIRGWGGALRGAVRAAGGGLDGKES